MSGPPVRASRRRASMSTRPINQGRIAFASTCPRRPRNSWKGRVQVINVWRPIRVRCAMRRLRCATAGPSNLAISSPPT